MRSSSLRRMASFNFEVEIPASAIFVGFSKPAGQNSSKKRSGMIDRISRQVLQYVNKNNNFQRGPSLSKERIFNMDETGKTVQSSSTCKNITVCTNNCVY